MTAARNAWLTKLLDGECKPVGRASVPFHCRKLGWSSFVVVAPDGRRISAKQAKAECQMYPFLNGYIWSDPMMEMITEEGRAALLADSAITEAPND